LAQSLSDVEERLIVLRLPAVKIVVETFNLFVLFAFLTCDITGPFFHGLPGVEVVAKPANVVVVVVFAAYVDEIRVA
jgi:hypothetical protein